MLPVVGLLVALVGAAWESFTICPDSVWLLTLLQNATDGVFLNSGGSCTMSGGSSSSGSWKARLTSM
jgi:hypothetical protein